MTPESRKVTGTFPPVLSNGFGGAFFITVLWVIHGLSWSNWNKFFVAIRTTRKFRMVVYHFCYYFWGQYCCWTETKILVTICLFFMFPFPSTFLLLPCPSIVLACLKKNMSEKEALLPTKYIFLTKVPSKLWICAVPPDNLGSEISFSRNCNIPKHCENIKTKRTYLNYVCTLFGRYFDKILYLFQ